MKRIVYGDIARLLRGEPAFEDVSLSQVLYGLGGAKVDSSQDALIAEALIWEHKAYLGTANELYEKKESIVVPFLVGIEKKPSQKHFFENMRIQEIYEQLIQLYPMGFACLGEAFYHTLKGTVLKKNPEKTSGPLSLDCFEQMEFEQIQGQSFGVAQQKEDPRIFYSHPSVKPLVPLSHTHVKTREHCMHLLQVSEVLKGTFWVEPFEN